MSWWQAILALLPVFVALAIVLGCIDASDAEKKP